LALPLAAMAATINRILRGVLDMMAVSGRAPLPP
jgi:hypothetical protein